MSFRWADPEDIGAILSLLRLSLGDKSSIPRSRDYWAWKHTNNPFGPSPILIAESDDQIVGLRVFMRWTWKSGEQNVESVRAVDTATHPDWRGQGIFSRLTMQLIEQMKHEGVSFVFNTPNKSSRPGYLKMGWSSLGRLSPWIRLRRPISMIRTLKRYGLGNQLDESVDLAPTTMSSGKCVGELLEVAGESLSNLEMHRQEDRRLITSRSLSYLRWRYLDIPGFDYRASWNWRNGSGAGVIYRVRFRGRLKELRLCEIIVASKQDSVRVAAGLIRDLARNSDADYMAALASSKTPERVALILAGFVPVPRLGPVLTVRPLTFQNDQPNPLKRDAWRLSIGDLELF